MGREPSTPRRTAAPTGVTCPLVRLNSSLSTRVMISGSPSPRRGPWNTTLKPVSVSLRSVPEVTRCGTAAPWVSPSACRVVCCPGRESLQARRASLCKTPARSLLGCLGRKKKKKNVNAS